MGPCDIKTSAKAWNDGVDAFKKAFKQTGGKTTESIKFAIDEINRQNPNFKFDVDSFVNPLVNSLKEKDVIPKGYSFKKGPSSEAKINKVVEKMSGMTPDQKKSFARKAFSQFEKDGMLTEDKVKNLYADAVGMPAMNDKVNEQIKNTSKALNEEKDVEAEIQKTIKEMQSDKDANGGKLTPEQNKSYENIFNNLGQRRSAAKSNTMKESAKFAEMLKEKKFWLHQLTDYMPLNLMNPNSLMKNVSGAIADAFTRTIGNSLASPISELAKFATGINSNPMFAKVRGVMNAKTGTKAAAAWKYGQTDFNSEIPQSNHLNAANRFRQAMDATGAAKFKGILSALLKVHPNLISKGLTVPDAIVYEMVYSSEMNRIAESKGLSGAEKKAFILDPDEKSVSIAKELAEAATFKQDLPEWAAGIKKLSAYDPHEQTKKLIAAGASPMLAKIRTGLRNVVQKSAVPFIKTPINIVRVASKILLPEYEFANAMIKAKNETEDATERQRLIIEGTTKAAAGFFVRNIAFQMIAQGLISAGYGDEDKKTKDFIEQEAGGPNRVNFSALMRALTFQGPVEKRNGDTYVELSALGALGITLAVYAHAYSKQSKDDIENNTSYSKNLLNAISIPYDLAWASLSSTLDFTFFTGINQLQSAVMNKEGYEANKLATDYIANLFTGVLPSTYQKFSTQSSPEVKKQFDKDLPFHDNLANALGYRFFFQSDNLKNKYYSLAEKDGGGLKKKRSMLFDNYMGRVLEAEFDFAKITKAPDDENPISRLNEALREVPKDDRDKLFPSSVGIEQSVKASKNGKKQTYKVDLTTKQHDYLQEQASRYRMIMATPFIMSDEFKNTDFETKTKVLQSLYSQGLDMAKKDLHKQFPDIKTQEKEGTRESVKKAKKLVKKYKVKELK